METTQSVSDTTQQTSGSTEQTETKEDVVSYATHRKLLSERKKDVEKLRRYESELEQFRQDKLSDEGKKDEVIDALRKQVSELGDKYQLSTNRFAKTTVSEQIKSALKAQGCINPDKAMRLMEVDDLNSIEVDDSYNVNSEDLSRVIDKFQKENEDLPLFNKVSGVKDLTPTNRVEYKEEKSFNNMTSDELVNEAKKMGSLF